MNTFRGHKMHQGGSGDWFFSDTNEPVTTTWKHRPCGHCSLPNTAEGYDGCLGYLPGVMNACCGHGEPKSAYMQFEDGSIIRGETMKHLSVAELEQLVCAAWWSPREICPMCLADLVTDWHERNCVLAKILDATHPTAAPAKEK